MLLTPEDRQQIHTLYAKYNFGIDMGPAESWADCWTAEGTMHIRGGTHTGRAALVAFAKEVLARPVKMRHWTTNLVIEEAPTGAIGKAYILVLLLTATPRPIQLTGLYEDELMKAPQGWRFSVRKVTFDNVA